MPATYHRIAALLFAAWTSFVLALPAGLSFELCSCGDDLTVCQIEAAPGCCEPSCCESERDASLPDARGVAPGDECVACTRVATGEREPLGPSAAHAAKTGAPEALSIPSHAFGVRTARALSVVAPAPELRPPPLAVRHRPLLI